eukprot:Rmarinus@m.3834
MKWYHLIFCHDSSIPSLIFTSLIAAVVYFEYDTPSDDWPWDPHFELYGLDAKDETIPDVALALMTILCPTAIIIGVEYFLVEPCREISMVRHHNALSLIAGMLDLFLMTLIATDLIKSYVGEPRPDYRERCLGDQYSSEEEYDINPDCSGSEEDVQEGRKSFPSGHASLSMAAFAYTAFFLGWTLYIRKTETPWRHSDGTWKVNMRFSLSSAAGQAMLSPLVLLPWFGALLIGASRIVDHLHHPWDVVGGWLLGWMMAVMYFFRNSNVFIRPYDAHMDDSNVPV